MFSRSQVLPGTGNTSRFISPDTAARMSRVQSGRKVQPRNGETAKTEQERLLDEMDQRSWAKRIRLEKDELQFNLTGRHRSRI